MDKLTIDIFVFLKFDNNVSPARGGSAEQSLLEAAPVDDLN